jgi:hypothetical protein
MVTVELSVGYLADCGRIRCFHVVPVFEQFGGLIHRDSRQGEDLKKGAVKGNQILIDQVVPGHDIFIHTDGEQSAYFVIGIKRKPLPV